MSDPDIPLKNNLRKRYERNKPSVSGLQALYNGSKSKKRARSESGPNAAIRKRSTTIFLEPHAQQSCTFLYCKESRNEY